MTRRGAVEHVVSSPLIGRRVRIGWNNRDWFGTVFAIAYDHGERGRQVGFWLLLHDERDGSLTEVDSSDVAEVMPL